MLDIKYFTHRMLALILTIFISYAPIFWEVIRREKISFINIMKHEEIIFSLLALLASCLFDLFENDIRHKTLALLLLVIDLIIITASIFLYIYQANDINEDINCWKYNSSLLIITIYLYVITYICISKEKRRIQNNINPI